MLSYLGPKHGRISQIHYDHSRWNFKIQSTQLMSFEEDANPPAPVELFLRYHVAKPVEPKELNWKMV